ncbi:MAG: DUF2141 domain-containing protein [Flavobacteriaceae bacterium]|nr:DUF2141 domain-containing protein [Flavobacteriaceae bacterium]
MKKIVILLITTILLSFTVKNNEEVYSLTIQVKDLRNSNGVIQFAIYNKEGSIPDEKFKKYYKKNIAVINNKTSTIIFNNLPKGRYAINILHDENKNGEIDKKFIMPIEGIGFSNYTSLGFSNKPKFSKASFELNSDIKIKVKVIYL